MFWTHVASITPSCYYMYLKKYVTLSLKRAESWCFLILQGWIVSSIKPIRQARFLNYIYSKKKKKMMSKLYFVISSKFNQNGNIDQLADTAIIVATSLTCPQ